MRTVNCRINAKYRPHLAAIARIYVQSGGNAAATERAVRQISGCGSFKAEFLKRWLSKAEFAAEVREAEAGAEAMLQLRPEVRGPKRILWLKQIEDELRKRYDGQDEEAAKDKTLGVLLKVGQDLRDEEKHVEDLAQKAARRQTSALVRNMVQFVKVRHAAAFASVAPVLRDIFTNLDAIQSGKFDQ